MSKRKTFVARRAWNVLRLALLWARKRGLMMELRLLPNYIKSLRHTKPHESIHYNEKEFSFDETPMFNFKMSRPNSMRFHIPSLPCLKPQVDFDFDYNHDDNDEREEVYGLEQYEDNRLHDGEIVQVDDEGIDSKAEEFIAKFYEQMKLQRQISYLQYNDMLHK